MLNDEELEGVLAHELGHVNNRDILISSIAATIAGAITYLARFGFFFGGGGNSEDRRGGGIGALLMLILAPIAAMMIQMAFRDRVSTTPMKPAPNSQAIPMR